MSRTRTKLFYLSFGGAKNAVDKYYGQCLCYIFGSLWTLDVCNCCLRHFITRYSLSRHTCLLFFSQSSLSNTCLHYHQKWSMSDPVDATRGYSGKCLNALAKVLPGLIGGSADLASSNQAYLHNLGDFKQPDSPWGRNIRYGVREHAMAGISNGLALHGGGLIPFAATFLVFSDYMKNSIRLSALSRAGVIYIMTHDSIGLGEDGPTHQPVEHLAGLRAVPHLLLF